jgi:CBS domain-containing protein
MPPPARGPRIEATIEEAAMKVRELMTTDVLTIGPEAPLKDLARLLVAHRISGVPVCDAERHVIGVVSEADVLCKALGDERRGGVLSWLVDESVPPEKVHATVVREAMTSPALTISPLRNVDEAARLMTEHGVNRLPVVADGELVGIVTRADLVRAFTRADEEIVREVESELVGRTFWAEPGAVSVTAVSGHVRLAGRLQTRSDAELLARLVSRVAGVVAVESELDWLIDDSTRRGRRLALETVR